MKILHIETGRHLYGGALQVLYLMRGLKERNVDNHLVCPTGSDISQTAGTAATIHALSLRGELDYRFPLQLRRIQLHIVHFPQFAAKGSNRHNESLPTAHTHHSAPPGPNLF